MTPGDGVASCDMDAQEIASRLELSFEAIATAQDHIAPLTRLSHDEIESILGVTSAVATSIEAWRDQIVTAIRSQLRHTDAIRVVIEAGLTPPASPMVEERGDPQPLRALDSSPEIVQVEEPKPVELQQPMIHDRMPRLIGEDEETYSARVAEEMRKQREARVDGSRRSDPAKDTEDAMRKAQAVWGVQQ